MADNIDITPGTGKTIRTTDSGGIHTPHHNVDVIAPGSNLIGKMTVRNSADSADIDPLSEATFTGLVGQAVKADSLAVVLASDSDPIQLAAGNEIVGGLLLADSYYPQIPTPTTSANMTSLADVTPAPTSGQHTVIESVTVSAATAMIVTLKEETTGTILKVFNLTSGNLNAEWNPTRGLRLPNTNKKLQAISSASGQIDITVISHSAA